MSMDELLKKYLSQIVIEHAGPDTTDDELLGTDYVSIVFKIPMAMLLEYRINKGLEGCLDLVEFWKDTGLYDGLCSIAKVLRKSGFTYRRIKDFMKRNYGLSIDEKTAWSWVKRCG